MSPGDTLKSFASNSQKNLCEVKETWVKVEIWILLSVFLLTHQRISLHLHIIEHQTFVNITIRNTGARISWKSIYWAGKWLHSRDWFIKSIFRKHEAHCALWWWCIEKSQPMQPSRLNDLQNILCHYWQWRVLCQVFLVYPTLTISICPGARGPSFL